MSHHLNCGPEKLRSQSQQLVTPLGLHFPFLIVEAESSATGGNLYQAQNQAAVGGSSTLRILHNLLELKYMQNLDSESQESSATSDDSVQTSLSDNSSHMVFSVTTEGPIHELWLNFRRPSEEDFHMVCIGAWKTTMEEGSLSLLRHLWAVLRWGNGRFRDNIVDTLRDL